MVANTLCLGPTPWRRQRNKVTLPTYWVVSQRILPRVDLSGGVLSWQRSENLLSPCRPPHEFAGMTEGISIDPAVCHGKPVIQGTRVLVASILGALAGGDSREMIAEDENRPVILAEGP